MIQPVSPTVCPQPLTNSRTGEMAVIHSTRLGSGDKAMLRAMGLVERTPLRICRQGEPCIVEIGSTRMGLSRDLARQILVDRA